MVAGISDRNIYFSYIVSRISFLQHKNFRYVTGIRNSFSPMLLSYCAAEYILVDNFDLCVNTLKFTDLLKDSFRKIMVPLCGIHNMD